MDTPVLSAYQSVPGGVWFPVAMTSPLPCVPSLPHSDWRLRRYRRFPFGLLPGICFNPGKEPPTLARASALPNTAFDNGQIHPNLPAGQQRRPGSLCPVITSLHQNGNDFVGGTVSPILALCDLLILSAIPSFIHSFIHSCIHPFLHSFTQLDLLFFFSVS